MRMHFTWKRTQDSKAGAYLAVSVNLGQPGRDHTRGFDLGNWGVVVFSTFQKNLPGGSLPLRTVRLQRAMCPVSCAPPPHIHGSKRAAWRGRKTEALTLSLTPKHLDFDVLLCLLESNQTTIKFFCSFLEFRKSSR